MINIFRNRKVFFFTFKQYVCTVNNVFFISSSKVLFHSNHFNIERRGNNNVLFCWFLFFIAKYYVILNNLNILKHVQLRVDGEKCMTVIKKRKINENYY